MICFLRNQRLDLLSHFFLVKCSLKVKCSWLDLNTYNLKDFHLFPFRERGGQQHFFSLQFVYSISFAGLPGCVLNNIFH